MTAYEESSTSPCLFSIVTVVWNDCKGLQKTAESIRLFKTADVQWLVVDGGSTDGTAELAARLNSSESENGYVLADIAMSGRDAGIYDAMNKGVRAASGRYILFLNAGDCIKSVEAWQRMRKIVEVVPEHDVWYFSAQVLGRNGVSFVRHAKPPHTAIRHGVPGNHQATVYRTEAVRRFYFDLRYRVCGDYALDATAYRAGLSARANSLVLSEFALGGTSSKRLPTLWREAWNIQRDILNIPIFERLLSFARRVATTLVASWL